MGAALASHGRSHRFDPCHAHQHKRVAESPATAQLPADCQQTTCSRRENALSAVQFGDFRSSSMTTCLQSQIGQDRHLRRQGNSAGRTSLMLSVAVRPGPVMTAVNGTLVARPAARGRLPAADDGFRWAAGEARPG